jgi:hypothetical protein
MRSLVAFLSVAVLTLASGVAKADPGDFRGGPGGWQGGRGDNGRRDDRRGDWRDDRRGDWRGGGWRGGPGRGPGGPGFPGPRPGFPGGPGPGFPPPGPGPGPGFPGGPGNGGGWQGGFVQVHRFFTGRDHLYTTNIYEGQQFGFQYDGVGFNLAQNAGPNLAPVFRCFTGSSHFVSRDGNCEGQRNEGLLGFVSASPSPQMPTALTRCFNGISHLITTNAQECYQAGYHVEGTLGFVR